MASSRPKRISKPTTKYNDFCDNKKDKMKSTKKGFLSMLDLGEAPRNEMQLDQILSKEKTGKDDVSEQKNNPDFKFDFEGFNNCLGTTSHALLVLFRDSTETKHFEGFDASSQVPAMKFEQPPITVLQTSKENVQKVSSTSVVTIPQFLEKLKPKSSKLKIINKKIAKLEPMVTRNGANSKLIFENAIKLSDGRKRYRKNSRYRPINKKLSIGSKLYQRLSSNSKDNPNKLQNDIEKINYKVLNGQKDNKRTRIKDMALLKINKMPNVIPPLTRKVAPINNNLRNKLSETAVVNTLTNQYSSVSKTENDYPPTAQKEAKKNFLKLKFFCNAKKNKNRNTSKKRTWPEANDHSDNSEIVASNSKRLAVSFVDYLTEKPNDASSSNGLNGELSSHKLAPLRRNAKGLNVMNLRKQMLPKIKHGFQPKGKTDKLENVNSINLTDVFAKLNKADFGMNNLRIGGSGKSSIKSNISPDVEKRSNRLKPVSPLKDPNNFSMCDELTFSVKSFLDAGSQMIEIFTKSLQQQHENFLQSSLNFDETCQNVVSSMANLGDKIELEEMDNLICCFDKEQEDRKIYRNSVIRNLNFSQQAHMTLYNKMSELLKTL